MFDYGFLTEDGNMRFETWRFSRSNDFKADSLSQALIILGQMNWELVAFDGKRYIMKREI